MVIKKGILLLLFCWLAVGASGQEIVQKVYSVESTFFTYGRKIIKKADGGYLLFGDVILTPSTRAIYLLSIDSIGNVQWAKQYKTPYNDFTRDAIQVEDSCYLLTCNSSVPYPSNNSFLLKIDSEGNLIWSKTFGVSPYGQQTFIRSLIFKHNSYYLMGTTLDADSVNGQILSSQRGLLARADTSGQVLWAKNYGVTIDSSATEFKGFISNSNDGLIVIGQSASYDSVPDGSAFYFSIDSSGNTEWFYNSDSVGMTCITDAGDGYLFGGFHGEDGYSSTIFKSDYSGNILWTKHYCPNTLGPFSVKQIIKWDDNRYGFHISGMDINIIDSAGIIIESHRYHTGFLGAPNYYHIPAENTALIITGIFSPLSTKAGMIFLKTDSLLIGCNNAAIVCPDTIGTNTNTAGQILITPINIPQTIQPIADADVVSTDTIYCQTATSINAAYHDFSFEVYPNPVIHELIIISKKDCDVVVHDITGKEISVRSIKANTEERLPMLNLKSGVYILNFTANGFSRIKKIIKL